ncbi:hypothetical protein Guyu_038 [Pseudomonas phage Guyu]|nr:hypothetical protein PM394_gp38 [Pseudomonas phage Guyu]UAG58633.1 hypothetical protein Guyu_038 [Pseudomonas phage Guyu]UKH49190.1 hypothetical protein vBPaeTR_25 [Pseudomonas phage vB_Pae_TR]
MNDKPITEKFRDFVKEDGPRIFEEIKANRAKLEACPKHHFNIGDPPYKFGAKFTCTNCGGTMDAVQAFRYCQGYEAAGGDPNEVIEGFR